MDDVNSERIIEALNYLKEYGAKKEDLQRLVSKEELEIFKNQILQKLENLHQ